MFDNLPPEGESVLLSSSEETDTPADSASAEETTPDSDKNVSEDAKTPAGSGDKPEDVETDLHKESNPFKSRFDEVRSQRDEARSTVKELSSKVEDLVKEIATLKSEPKDEAPQFETVEDIQNFLSKFPDKVVDQVIAKIESRQNAEKQKDSETQQIIDSQLEQIQDEHGVSLSTAEQQKLFKFALDNQFKSLPAAYKLMVQLEGKGKDAKTEETKQKIANRKKQSGTSTAKSVSGEVSHIHVPGQSLDDIVSELQANLTN